MVKETSNAVCMRCGSTSIEDASIDIVGGSYSGLRVRLKQGPGDHRKVKGLVCLDCGYIEMYLEADIIQERVTKIAKQLQKEFERWPRKRMISLEDLRYKVWISKRVIIDLLGEVRHLYPHFRRDSIDGIDYLIFEER